MSHKGRHGRHHLRVDSRFTRLSALGPSACRVGVRSPLGHPIQPNPSSLCNLTNRPSKAMIGEEFIMGDRVEVSGVICQYAEHCKDGNGSLSLLLSIPISLTQGSNHIYMQCQSTKPISHWLFHYQLKPSGDARRSSTKLPLFSWMWGLHRAMITHWSNERLSQHGPTLIHSFILSWDFCHNLVPLAHNTTIITAKNNQEVPIERSTKGHGWKRLMGKRKENKRWLGRNF